MTDDRYRSRPQQPSQPPIWPEEEDEWEAPPRPSSYVSPRQYQPAPETRPPQQSQTGQQYGDQPDDQGGQTQPGTGYYPDSQPNAQPYQYGSGGSASSGQYQDPQYGRTGQSGIPSLGRTFENASRQSGQYPADYYPPTQPTSYEEPAPMAQRRRPSNQPAVTTDPSVYGTQANYGAVYDASSDLPYPAAAAATGVPTSARRTRSRGQSAGTAASSISIPQVSDKVVVGSLIAALLGLLFMVVTLASQIGGLEDWIPIHLDASGDIDRWASKSTLWEIPFGILMMVIMSLIVAYFISKRDQLAGRLVAVSMIMVQILGWIALVDFLR